MECPLACGGRMKVVNTIVSDDGKYRIRYHACGQCGHRPDNHKLTIPISHAPRRIATGSSSSSAKNPAKD
jgi:hypothetical protein